MNRKPDEPAPKDDAWHQALRAAKDSGDPDRWFAQQSLDAAKNGDVDAACDILEDFCNEVDRHSASSWEMVVRAPRYYFQAEYLAQCFRAILDGEEPAKALNLIRSGKGRPPADTEKEQKLAACFWLLVGEGHTQDAILAAMGDDKDSPWHTSRSTVRRAKDEWRAYQAMERQMGLAMFRGDNRLDRTRELLNK
jgi:hypothetical protein